MPTMAKVTRMGVVDHLVDGVVMSVMDCSTGVVGARVASSSSYKHPRKVHPPSIYTEKITSWKPDYSNYVIVSKKGGGK